MRPGEPGCRRDGPTGGPSGRATPRPRPRRCLAARLSPALGLLMALGHAQTRDDQPPGRLVHDSPDLSVRIVERSTTQLRAFYLARGFSNAAIDRLLGACIVTALIHNRSHPYLWLELDQWRFTRDGRPVARIPRADWQPVWEDVGLPLAQQATFGWTLLPEVRDLRPDEHAGGAITLTAQPGPFDLAMRFRTGEDRRGPVRHVTIEDLTCQQT